MDIGEFTLAELLTEVAVRIQHTNGLDFVPEALADLVVAGIEDYREEIGMN